MAFVMMVFSCVLLGDCRILVRFSTICASRVLAESMLCVMAVRMLIFLLSWQYTYYRVSAAKNNYVLFFIRSYRVFYENILVFKPAIQACFMVRVYAFHPVSEAGFSHTKICDD